MAFSIAQFSVAAMTSGRRCAYSPTNRHAADFRSNLLVQVKPEIISPPCWQPHSSRTRTLPKSGPGMDYPGSNTYCLIPMEDVFYLRRGCSCWPRWTGAGSSDTAQPGPPQAGRIVSHAACRRWARQASRVPGRWTIPISECRREGGSFRSTAESTLQGPVQEASPC